MSDRLRLAAIASQLIGFVVIFLLRTYEAAAFWQGLVLAAMLASAFVIWLLRRYQRNKVRRDRDVNKAEQTGGR